VVNFPPKLSPPKSRAERDSVWRSDLFKVLQSPEQNAILFQKTTPPKLSEVQRELDFVPRSNLSEALRSPEQNAILFREATDSLRKKKAKCSII
jgi:hypothetical protein